MKNNIKISQTSWLAAGIKKGIVKPEEDGSFTLNKEALGPALVVTSLFGNALRTFATTVVAGGLVSLWQKGNVTSKIKDWWNKGEVTPEMYIQLKSNQKAFEESKGLLYGTTDRLDAQLDEVSRLFEEKLNEFGQILDEKGIGPAQMRARQIVLNKEMKDATQKAPGNMDVVKSILAQRKSNSAVPESSVTQAPPAATPAAPSETKPATSSNPLDNLPT